MKYLTITILSIFSIIHLSSECVGQTMQENQSLLGQALSVIQQYGTPPSGNGVNSSTSIKIAGKSYPLLSTIVQYSPANNSSSMPPNDPLAALLGNTNHDFYLNGIKVYSDSTTLSNGSVVYTGAVPPGQLAIPVFSYIVGPLVLAVDVGVSYEAAITGKLTPLLGGTLQDSSVSASINASAAAAGFVEGLARALIIQAGIGGSVNILEGQASVAARTFFQGSAPQLTYGGKLSVLSGKIYAFVDYKRLFGDWQRLESFNLYQWPGKCWAMGASACANN